MTMARCGQIRIRQSSGRLAVEGLAFLAACLALSLFARPVMADGNGWLELETRNTVVRYSRAEDLTKLEDAIDYNPDGFSIGGLFSSPGAQEAMGAVARKIDALFERVQEILDMRGKTAKVRINAYGDQARLHQAYREIAGGECRVRAWYIYERNTVFINVEDVNESMLAHELAHAIIDHFLAVRPPRATAEILARYVDEHLNF
jgi:hypothetical protein